MQKCPWALLKFIPFLYCTGMQKLWPCCDPTWYRHSIPSAASHQDVCCCVHDVVWICLHCVVSTMVLQIECIVNASPCVMYVLPWVSVHNILIQPHALRAKMHCEIHIPGAMGYDDKWMLRVLQANSKYLGRIDVSRKFFPEEALGEIQTFGFQFIVPTSIVCRWLKEALSRISIFGFLRCGFGSFLGGRSSHKRNSWGRLYPFQALSWVDFSGEALSRIRILGFHPPFGI